MAAKVTPPMTESEMTKVFIDAQEAPYYDKLAGMIGKSFSEIIQQAEVVERGLRSGKMVDVVAMKLQMESLQSHTLDAASSLGKKHDRGEEVTMVHRPAIGPRPRHHPRSTLRPHYPCHHPQPILQPQTQMHPQAHPGPFRQDTCVPTQDQRRPPQSSRYFTPLPMTTAEIYAILLRMGKIQPAKAPERNPRVALPPGFDPSRTCHYHSNALGHSTEDCFSLKQRIQDMIDDGDLIVEGDIIRMPGMDDPLPGPDA